MAKYLDLKVGKKLKIYRFNTGSGQNGNWAFFSYTPYEKNQDGSTTYGQEYTIQIANIDNVQFELKDGVSVEVDKINSVTADFQSYKSKQNGQMVNKTVIKVSVDIVTFTNGQTLQGSNPNVFTPNPNGQVQQPQYNNQNQPYNQPQFDDPSSNGYEFPFNEDDMQPNF